MMGWVDWIIAMLIEMEIMMYRSMGQNLKRHQREEEKEAHRWTQWQALQARSLRSYRKKLTQMVNKTFDEVIPEAEKQISKAFHDAATAWDEKTIKAYKAAGKPIPWEHLPVYQPEQTGIRPVRLDPKRFGQTIIPKSQVRLTPPGDDTFFRINEDRLKIVVKDVRRDMNRARYAAAQRAGAQYEEIIKRADVFYQTGTMTRDQAIEKATEAAADQGLNCIQYRTATGRVRRVNVASYVDMALRTSAHRAALTAEGAKRDEWEEYLVISPTLHSTCDICLKWQGEILIDDVFAHGKPDDKHELLSTAIRDGFIHPNCRHPLVSYIEGITQIPKKSPLNKTRRQYKAEQRQRQIELYIRKYKRREAIAQTEEAKEEAAQMVKAWQQRMREHLEDNPHLRRNYQREKLMGLRRKPYKSVKDQFTNRRDNVTNKQNLYQQT